MKCLLLACLLAAVTSHAQRTGQARIDSLLNELPKAKEDTAKVALLAFLAESNELISLDDQLKYAVRSLELAKKLGEEKHIAIAYNVLGNAYSDGGNNDEAIQNYLGAQIIVEKIGKEREIIGVKINIGLTYTRQGNFEAALDYLESALASSKKLGDSELTAASHMNLSATKHALAHAYYDKNERHKSRKLLDEALKGTYAAIAIYKGLDKKKELAECYQGLGSIFLPLENLHEAEVAYSLSLALAQELDIKLLQARDILAIAKIYFMRKEYVRAEEECKKGLSIAEDCGNSDAILWAGGLLKSIREAVETAKH